MKLAAACGLFHYNEEVANDLKSMSSLVTGGDRKNRERVPKRRCLAIKTLKWMLREVGVTFTIMEHGVAIDCLCSGSLVEEGDLLFAKVVDQKNL